MKMTIRVIGLFIVGLLVAIIIYPTLHELGHSIAAILVGGNVLEFNVFPLPNILCDVRNISDVGIIAIGLGGMLMPYMFSILATPKNFWCWYLTFLIKGISLLAFVISVVGAVLYMLDKPIPNEDITRVLDAWQTGEYTCLITLGILTIIAFLEIIKEKPIQRCIDYFINSIEKTTSKI